MKPSRLPTLNPALDLRMTRQTHVAVDQVWRAWTTPDLLMQWFCPRPWKTVACEMELIPGGRFYTVMESPEGDQFPGESCILEVVENRRFVWTNALLPGYRPNPSPESCPGADSIRFTAIIEMEPAGSGTAYSATLIHGDEGGRKTHEAMGFESGWGTAFEQLVELMSGR